MNETMVPTMNDTRQRYHLRFHAMNCEMAAWVIAEDEQAARAQLAAVRDFVQEVEARLSRFNPDSELSRLNASPGQAVPVSPLLWDVLTWALDSARHTEGLYDPTMLSALEAAGYDRTFQEVTRRDDRSERTATSIPAGTWRDIRLDPAARTVTLPPGVRLDLAGVAKGWTADRAADQLAALGPCLVDIGGDIAVRGTPPETSGWPVGIMDPRDPEADLALLMVRDRGIATSGIDYRRWIRSGQTQHHIIDPRTRRPADTDLLTVTVIAPSAAQADLYALVTLILGSEEGWRYLSRQPDVEGLLMKQDGHLLITTHFTQYVYHPEIERREEYDAG